MSKASLTRTRRTRRQAKMRQRLGRGHGAGKGVRSHTKKHGRSGSYMRHVAPAEKAMIMSGDMYGAPEHRFINGRELA
jgi:hypothetical protein